jgi:hypothetical protein
VQAGAHWHAAQQEFEEHFGAKRAAELREELFDLTKRQTLRFPGKFPGK